MSDSQRIRGLGGIKPTRMPASSGQEISVTEAEQRLGIASGSDAQSKSEQSSHTGSTLPSIPISNTAHVYDSLPESLLKRKPKQVTVSRTFRLPLELADELEKVARIHDLPMVTILAEALQIHLARFPR